MKQTTAMPCHAMSFLLLVDRKLLYIASLAMLLDMGKVRLYFKAAILIAEISSNDLWASFN